MHQPLNSAQFQRAAEALPTHCFERPPTCGVILGSGWSNALKTLMKQPLARMGYQAIPGLGVSTVSGHAGEFVLFDYGAARVAAFMGRRHWYEGDGWTPVVLPVELLRRMGAQNLLITNAAGGIRDTLAPGDLMLLNDHLNTVGLSPLIGPPVAGWGPRFPDQSRIYTPRLQTLLRTVAQRNGTTLHEGVYAFTTGPGYETPAEIRAYAQLGADAVGMSTVPEAVVANAIGIPTAAISCISNMAAGVCDAHLAHSEVLAATQRVQPVMAALMAGFWDALGESH